MRYTVYEVFPDGKKFFRFENNDHFECEVYVNQHWYDYPRSGSKLVIEEEPVTIDLPDNIVGKTIEPHATIEREIPEDWDI